MTANMLGSHHDSRPSRTVAEWLWPFLPMGFAAFSASALFWFHWKQNLFEVRSPLQQLYASVYRTVGFAPALMFCGLVVVWSTIWLVVGTLERPVSRLLRLVAMAVLLGIFLNLGDGRVSAAPHQGALGAWLADTLVGTFGYWPSLVLVAVMTLASLLLATDFFFFDSFERMRAASGRERETGVEAAVTEHLRGLGTPAAGVGASAASAGTTSSAGGANATAAAPSPSAPAVDAGGDAAAAALAAPVDEPYRRRSYRERREERESRSWRRPADEEWVPAAPESQEIDDPEIAAANAAADAATNAADSDADAGAPSRRELDGAGDADDAAFAARLAAAVADSADELARDERARRGEDADTNDTNDANDAHGTNDEDAAADAPHAQFAPTAASSGLAAEPVDDADTEPLADGAEDPDAAGAARGRRGEVIVFPDELSPAGRSDDDASGAGGPVPPGDERIVAIPRPEPSPPAVPLARGERAERAHGDDDAHGDAPAGAEPRHGNSNSNRNSNDDPRDAEEPAARQQRLFSPQLDEDLVQEAIEIVTGSRRASVAFLQRKLRIDYALANDVLAELAARGVVALEGDATHGRVLG